MAQTDKSVIIFHTSNHAFRAESVLKKQNLWCKLRPVPRHLSSDCGVCAQISTSQVSIIEQLLLSANVEIADIQPL